MLRNNIMYRFIISHTGLIISHTDKDIALSVPMVECRYRAMSLYRNEERI
jgi:hypothetical protein